MTETFKKGEIVWAKVKGYPWWPGVVHSVDFTILIPLGR